MPDLLPVELFELLALHDHLLAVLGTSCHVVLSQVESVQPAHCGEQGHYFFLQIADPVPTKV